MPQSDDHFAGDFFRSTPPKEALWRFIQQPQEAASAVEGEVSSAKSVRKHEARSPVEFHIPHQKTPTVTFLHIPHRVTASRLSRKSRLTNANGDPLAPHSDLLAAPVRQLHIKQSSAITVAPVAKKTHAKSAPALGITAVAKAAKAPKIRTQSEPLDTVRPVQKTKIVSGLTIETDAQARAIPSIIVGNEQIPLVPIQKERAAFDATRITSMRKKQSVGKKTAFAEASAFTIPHTSTVNPELGKMSRHRIPTLKPRTKALQSQILPLTIPQQHKLSSKKKLSHLETIPETEMQKRRQAYERRQVECARRIQLVIDLTRKDFANLGKLRPKEEVEKELAEKRRLAAKPAVHHTLQGRRFMAKQKKAKRQSFVKSTLGEITRFAITSAAIFGISFSVMNAPALSQLMMARIDPVATVEKQVALEKVSAADNQKPALPILPTAGMQRETHKVFPPLAIRPAPLENRIVIPKIGKNIPVVGVAPDSLLKADWNQLEKDIQESLKDGVVHYPGTAEPGQLGNVFITGHSSYYFWDGGKYKDVFARLHDLDVGDEFTIFWEQDVYKYRIRERKVVPPEETSVLKQPRNEKIATLMTCTPIGTAKDRLILVAEQLN